MSGPARRAVVVVAVAAVGLGGVGGWLVYRSAGDAPGTTAVADAHRQEPTFRSADGSTQVQVPSGGMEPGTAVTFTTAAGKVSGLNAGMRGARAAGTPVDIQP